MFEQARSLTFLRSLARCLHLGASEDDFAQIIANDLKDENGNYYNKRLHEEIIKRSTFVDSRRNNGKLGGRPSKPLGKPSGKPKENRKANLSENENENENVNEDEVAKYFEEKGYSKEAAKKFYDYYSVGGWKDSKGNKVKNWKQKAQAVWFKEVNKIQVVKKSPFVH